jgi:hypothetical protein
MAPFLDRPQTRLWAVPRGKEAAVGWSTRFGKGVMVRRLLLVLVVALSALLAPGAASPLIGGEETGPTSYTGDRRRARAGRLAPPASGRLQSALGLGQAGSRSLQLAGGPVVSRLQAGVAQGRQRPQPIADAVVAPRRQPGFRGGSAGRRGSNEKRRRQRSWPRQFVMQ